MQKLLIIDGNSLIFRAYYATEHMNFQTSEGTPSNAVYGFANMLSKLINEHDFTHIMVALDGPSKTFRKEDFQDYKSNRKELRPELKLQFPLVRELLTALDIHWLEIQGFEADDIIGTICTKYIDTFDSIQVITGDKDLLQLLNEKVEVKILKKGVSEFDIFTPEKLKSELGLTPLQFIDYKGLMGDTADNIPGVPGIGPKTAQKLLHEFDSIEGIYNNLSALKGKVKENLEQNHEQALLSKRLATIINDIDFEFNFAEFSYTNPKFEQLKEFYIKMNFRRMLEDLLNNASLDQEEVEPIQLSFTSLNETTKLKAVLPIFNQPNYHLQALYGVVALDQNDNVIALTIDQIRHQKQNFANLLQPGYITFDAKALIVSLLWEKIDILDVNFEDILIGQFVKDSNFSSYEIDKFAGLIGYPQSINYKKIFSTKAQLLISEEELFSTYASLLTYMLENTFNEQIDQIKKIDGLESYQLEINLIPVLAKMEYNGINIDKTELNAQKTDVTGRLDQIKTNIYDLIGYEFNINSTKQLGQILFEELLLPSSKKTKTGYSTNQAVLEEIVDMHPVIKPILEYRKLNKILTTYIDGLFEVIHPRTEKIHTIYQQAVARTGRLSSIYPNMQNLPVRENDGRNIRKAFKSDAKTDFLAIDYSQIELRVLAHTTGAKEYLEAFNNDLDIHKLTAAKIFNINVEDVTSVQRSQAKTVNFGIIYGQSAYGLSQELQITPAKAKEFIAAYYQNYPSIQVYMNQQVEFAKKNEFVETIIKRRRYIPQINVSNKIQAEFAKRIAINSPIQGSAADIMKYAMIKLNDYIEMNNLNVKMILQIHDEIVFQIDQNENQAKVVKELANVMHEAFKLKVKLETDSQVANNLYDLK